MGIAWPIAVVVRMTFEWLESSSQKKAFSLRLKINANKEPKRGFNYHLIKSKQDNVIIGSKLAPRANFL